jgi:hypothetical protein
MVVVQLITEPQIRRAAEILGYSLTNNEQFVRNVSLPFAPYLTTKVFSSVNEETTIRICHFHHPYVGYRVEMPRTDTVDVAEYEACRERGAMVVTAHDHIYARTQVFTNYAKQVVAKARTDEFVLTPGKSFAVISGNSYSGLVLTKNQAWEERARSSFLLN